MNATRWIGVLRRACILPLLSCGAAFAQNIPILGNWSGDTMGPDGPRRYAMTITRDENYVWMVKLPNGVIQKTWGKWQILSINTTEARVLFRSQGWLPLQTCVKGSGPLQRCSPYFPPSTPSPSTLRFASSGSFLPGAAPRLKDFEPQSFQLDGANWKRELAPSSLLQQIVRDHQTLTSAQSPATRAGMPAPRKYGIPP